jgi:hypothetical protein
MPHDRNVARGIGFYGWTVGVLFKQFLSVSTGFDRRCQLLEFR